jgi:hypothetical protein
MIASENSVLKLWPQKSSHKARPILAELQSAIHQYTQRLRNRAAGILTGRSEFTPERRKTSPDAEQRSTP